MHLLQVMRLPCVFEYLHVPVQSGSNRVLSAMNREYTVEGEQGGESAGWGLMLTSIEEWSRSTWVVSICNTRGHLLGIKCVHLCP